jgi:hypothetical protein
VDTKWNWNPLTLLALCNTKKKKKKTTTNNKQANSRLNAKKRMLFFTIRILGSRHGPAQLISREVEQVKTISYGIGKANVTKNIAEI